MATEARGLICLAMEASGSIALELPLRVDRQHDSNQTAFTSAWIADLRNGVSTGISGLKIGPHDPGGIHPAANPRSAAVRPHLSAAGPGKRPCFKRPAIRRPPWIFPAPRASMQPVSSCEIQNVDGSMARLPQNWPGYAGAATACGLLSIA